MPSYVTVNNGAEEKSLTIENLCLLCIKYKPCKQVRSVFIFIFSLFEQIHRKIDCWKET